MGELPLVSGENAGQTHAHSQPIGDSVGQVRAHVVPPHAAPARARREEQVVAVIVEMLVGEAAGQPEGDGRLALGRSPGLRVHRTATRNREAADGEEHENARAAHALPPSYLLFGQVCLARSAMASLMTIM